MKKWIMFMIAGIVAFSFATASFAGGTKVMGEVIKAEGDFVTIKDEKGKTHKFHVDKTTKQTGEVKVGAKVEAEATDMGHATAITVKEGGK